MHSLHPADHADPTPRAVVTLRDPHRNELFAVAVAVGVSVAALALGIVANMAGIALSNWTTPRPLPALHVRLASLPAGPPIDPEIALHGRSMYDLACTVCHGVTGLGRPGLGRDLVHSDFVADRGDGELVRFLTIGRPVTDPLNTTRVAMPPRGGHDTLTDADLAAIVAYVRGLQDPRRLPDLPPRAPAKPADTAAELAAALEAAGGDEELAEFIASGRRLYAASCVACHGADGVGITGSGKPLRNNPFIQERDDDALLAFLLRGRDPSDPINTTGVGMPAKGGNPALDDDDLLDIIAFLRTLQATSP